MAYWYIILQGASLVLNLPLLATAGLSDPFLQALSGGRSRFHFVSQPQKPKQTIWKVFTLEVLKGKIFRMIK